LEGSVQFKDVTQALAEVGYDGYVTAEMLPFQPGRPEKTIEAMRRIFG
jgi:sugar phosphate isomerase/epimerase